jgi:hypothetical protein
MNMNMKYILHMLHDLPSQCFQFNENLEGGGCGLFLGSI